MGVLVFRLSLNMGLSDVFLISMGLWTFGNTAKLSCLTHISVREYYVIIYKTSLVVFNLDPLAIVVFARFLHCKIAVFPFQL